MEQCPQCQSWLEPSSNFCPECGEPVEHYAKPAGFWIRFVASLVDGLVFLPVVILTFVNLFSIKSIPLLLVMSIPQFLYKPLMEARYGATLGKMACGLKVIDDQGASITVSQAYTRFIPLLVSTAVGVVASVVLFSQPGFQNMDDFQRMSELQNANPANLLSSLCNFVVLGECLVAAFSHRKRALHDMMAKTFCVYK